MEQDRTPSVENKSQVDREIPKGMKGITEGSATIVYKKDVKVFYNQVQVANRDLSVAIITLFAEMIAKEQGKEHAALYILEALSATGLRSIRYWNELLPHVHHIIANDIDSRAVDAIKNNVEFNNISTEHVQPHQGDAALLMYQRGLGEESERFHVVDIDPYGTCAPFLDSAVRAVKNGGLLCVTSTDMIVLCGNNPEVCYSNYGASPSRGKHCHEMATRIILGSLERAANRYKRHIEVLVAVQMDFYVRVFVRVHHSPASVKQSYTKMSYVYQCVECKSLHFQDVGETKGRNQYRMGRGPPVSPTCEECGGSFQIAGPIWNKELCNPTFVNTLITHLDNNPSKYASTKKLSGMLYVLLNELPDAPLFHNLSVMCKTLKLSTPPMNTFRSALLNMEEEYKVSISHTDSMAIKTNAGVGVLWDILRAWALTHPVKTRGQHASKTPGARILARPPRLHVDFTPNEHAQVKRDKKRPRFVPNPPNWGPGTRSRINKRATKDIITETKTEPKKAKTTNDS